MKITGGENWRGEKRGETEREGRKVITKEDDGEDEEGGDDVDGKCR